MAINFNLTMALVALVFTLFTWLGGGIVGSWLNGWTVWLTLLVAEVALVLPEQKRNESLFDARRRVGKAVLCDPLTWLTLLLTGFFVIQWLNGGTFMEWDVSAQKWLIRSPVFTWMQHPDTATLMSIPPADTATVAYRQLPPMFDWLPGSFRSDEAYSVLNWFPPVLVSLLAVRHALLKRTKRLLVDYICAMTAVLAVAGIIQYALGGTFLYWGRHAGAFFFATFGYPNHAAGFFPAVMAVSVGLMMWAHEHREHTRVPPWLYGVFAVLCAVSGILSGSRAGVIFTLAVGGFTVMYAIFRYFGTWSPRLRIAVPGVLLAVALFVGWTVGFRVYALRSNAERAEALRTAVTAEERQKASSLPTFSSVPMLDGVLGEIDDTDWAAFFEHPMLMRSGYQGILALRQHADHPWVGTGAWSFRWLNVRYINRDNPEEKGWFESRKGVGQANVHNDTLQYLAEHGWVGFGLMLAIIAALALPFLKQLFCSPAYTVSDEQADRSWINRINVVYVFFFVATAMMAAHSFVDLVFRSPACMMLYGLMFVCAPGFLLGRRKTAKTASVAVSEPPTSIPQA